MTTTAVSAFLASSGAGAGAAPAADPRLRPAAHEFEACLMKELLEPMQHNALFGDDENGAEGSDSALMSFGSEGLAKAISERGGFGIAAKILAHFSTRKPGQTAGTAKNILKMGREI